MVPYLIMINCKILNKNLEGNLQDWKDFGVFYCGSFPLIVITVWAFSVVFMTLGVFLRFPPGEKISAMAYRLREKWIDERSVLSNSSCG